LPFEEHENSILSAKTLYYAAEWPYCHQEDNPNVGGEPTEYPFELMEPLRRAIVPVDTPEDRRNVILVINRGTRYRHVIQHDEIISSLKRLFEPIGFHVSEFGPEMLNSPLEEHVALFNRARLVIGPHGAGFGNLVFCAQGTAVIEIGFDGTDGMQLDEMYYQLSVGLRLRYWLVLGAGAYSTNIDVSVADILSASFEALDVIPR